MHINDRIKMLDRNRSYSLLSQVRNTWGRSLLVVIGHNYATILDFAAESSVLLLSEPLDVYRRVNDYASRTRWPRARLQTGPSWRSRAPFATFRLSCGSWSTSRPSTSTTTASSGCPPTSRAFGTSVGSTCPTTSSGQGGGGTTRKLHGLIRLVAVGVVVDSLSHFLKM